MAGTESYHDYPQPFRIQKRLVLNQCFKCIHDCADIHSKLTYVTFGGEHLYDVMDLVSVFDIRHHKLDIISYEENEEVALKSRTCPVASNLSKVSTITVEIVPTAFLENSKAVRALRPSAQFIYF